MLSETNARLFAKDNDSWITSERNRAATVSRGYGDVLFAAKLVGDDAARDRAACRSLVKRLTIARIERQERAPQVAGEENIPSRRRDRSVHRRRPMIAPCHLAGLRIDGIDPARPCRDRVVRSEAVR